MRMSEDSMWSLVRREPEVMSPVEMAFDESGKVYVAEMLTIPRIRRRASRRARAIRLLQTPAATARRGRAPCSRRMFSR